MSNLSEKIEIRIAGRGGQGILLASNVLAAVLAESYDYVAQSGSYGSEARGTVSSADVVAAGGQLAYPKVQKADLLALLAPEAAAVFAPLVAPEAVILYDPDMVPETALSGADGALRRQVSAAQKANDLGSSLHLNMVLLGAISTVLTEMPGLEIRPAAFHKAITKRFSARRAEAGLTAFDVGRSSVKS